MAKKRRRPTRVGNDHQSAYPGWIWMLFGLAIGLSVAFVIYLNNEKSILLPEPTTQQPASMTTPIQPAQSSTPPAANHSANEKTEPRFSFYSMLPNFEVIIPEEEPNVSRDNDIDAIQRSGRYVLQAGSFTQFPDADRRKAQLALLGIESKVQRIAIDDRTYHRVRIGPISDLDQLNLVRRQLRQAEIEILRIRLGD